MWGNAPHVLLLNDSTECAIISFMDDRHYNRKKIGDSRVWDMFTDCLVVSAIVLGFFTFMERVNRFPSYGYPAGTFVAIAFAMIAAKGRSGAFRDTPAEPVSAWNMMGYTTLGTCTGIIVSFLGLFSPIRFMTACISGLLLPVTVIYPLISEKSGKTECEIIKDSFRPSFPHIMLWLAEAGSGSVISGLILGLVCSAFEICSGWISGRIETETRDRLRHFINTVYTVAMTLASALLLMQGGISLRACFTAVLGTGTGLLAGKAVSDIPLIQIAAGVAVASFITLLGYLAL